MSYRQPTIPTANGERRFACCPVALQAILVNEREEVLLLYSPTRRPGGWQVVAGAMEARETILGGVLREMREEIGPHAHVRPLGVVHARSFHLDRSVRYMISVYYLLAYEGGEIVPGDDMAGSDYRWWRVADLGGVHLRVPPDEPWILRRAVELYRLWRDQDVPLREIE